MFKNLLILMLAMPVISCTHALHLNHSGDHSPVQTRKSTRIKSVGEQFTVMGVTQETNYVNTAFNDLKSQCPDGVVSRIQTRYSTSHNFFSWTNKVKMTAICKP